MLFQLGRFGYGWVCNNTLNVVTCHDGIPGSVRPRYLYWKLLFRRLLRLAHFGSMGDCTRKYIRLYRLQCIWFVTWMFRHPRGKSQFSLILRLNLNSRIGLFYGGYGAILLPALGIADSYGGKTSEYYNALGFFILSSLHAPHSPTL